MNDVHLHRFVWDDGEAPSLRTYTEQPPAVRCIAGDSKDFSPSNGRNDSKKDCGASMARAHPKLARGVGHAVPKRKFRTAFANTARNLRKYVNSQTNSLPCRRAADDIAVRANRNLIRQLVR